MNDTEPPLIQNHTQEIYNQLKIQLETGEHRKLKSGKFWQEIPAYHQTDESQFNNYHWQLRNSVTSAKDLLKTVRDIIDPEFYRDAEEGFRRAPMAVRVTPYIISLINWRNPGADPLRKQYIPLSSSLCTDHPELGFDSLSERSHSPEEGLTHRYPDKVLLLALDHCPVYCRYCTRSYAIGFDTATVEKLHLGQSRDRLQNIFRYIRNRPTVEDVVISGGDVSMLRPERLRWIGETLLKMPNIRRIRFATKAMAILPQKFLTHQEWYNALKSVHRLGRKMHKEVCVHTHFSHPHEITEISLYAMHRLMEDGITVRNQAVLQRGVNDDPEIMTLLIRRLSYINIHPYYVYMHDLVKGVEDLRTTLETGLYLEKWVRGSTAGYNTPSFVVDLPGGGGKRSVHSYEYYDRETGISVYTAPGVQPGSYFFYFDPLHLLSPDIQRAWQDPLQREEMKQTALNTVVQGRYRQIEGVENT